MDSQPSSRTSGGTQRRPGTRTVDARRQSLSALLRAMLAHGPVARAELAQLTGLTTGAVTKLTAVLGEAGLLRELTSAPRESAPGRPRIPVEVDTTRYRVVGLHIGLRRTHIGLVNLQGELVREHTMSHRSSDFRTVIKEAIHGVRALLAEDSGTALALGASTGGWVDAGRGTVLEQSVLGWRDAPMRDALEEGLGLPVRIDSSFRALALAEHLFGEHAGAENLVHLFVGNVVGAGFLLNGRLFRGTTSAAGALDHLPVDGRADEPCQCGRRDCLHVVTSDLALIARARADGLLGADGAGDELIALARGGETRAERMLARRARQVGTAAGILIEMFDPQIVTVGGGVLDAPEYLDQVRSGADRYLADKRDVDVAAVVHATSFHARAIAASSAAVAVDAFYRDPVAFVPALGELRYG